MSVHSIIEQLDRWGPGQRPGTSTGEAMAYCRRLALGHYENFSVLSRMVPEPMREGAAVVYAFCRWADDLGDEIKDHSRSLELLDWWRNELNACFAGEGFHHPVFIALASIRERYGLESKPFLDLIDAFEQDQRIGRYDTWDQLVDYCSRSADPVGRLVLRLADQDHDQATLAASDAICTALQLANHWQDARRDLVERDRIYIPAECHGSIQSFEDRFRWTIEHGHSPDHEFLDEWRAMMQSIVKRTWPGFEKIDPLLERLTPELRPMIWLFAAGGSTILRKIERINYETILFRPKINLFEKLSLLLLSRRAARRSVA
ncbi:MAG: squalene/phytoene synthase family protein [Phycisphaerales bacterium]|nr:squalene/phytoene synthase family protein [Phycisphaerales bacterium]